MAVWMQLRPERQISFMEWVFFAGQTLDIVCWALCDVAHLFCDRQERDGGLCSVANPRSARNRAAGAWISWI